MLSIMAAPMACSSEALTRVPLAAPSSWAHPRRRGEVAHQLAEGVQLVEDGGAGPLTVGSEQPEGARRRDAQPVDHGRAELRARVVERFDGRAHSGHLLGAHGSMVPS